MPQSTQAPVSRYPVPALESLPEDIRARILKVQEKSGFIPNVFLMLAYRPDEFRAFMAYHDALMDKPGGLTQAEREPGVGNPPQQVVEVAVRGDQGVGLEAGAGQEARQRLELVREVGRVDQHSFVVGAERDRVRLPEPARYDEDVPVDRDGPQAAFNSLPASRKVFTSASGFLRPSRSSPWRFTQITGIFDLRHGSTSVG